jgi:predicted esterase
VKTHDLALFAALFAALVACGSPAATVDSDTASVETSTADVATGPALPSGEFYISVDVVPFGGVLLPFKATVVATGTLSDGGTFNTFELRAVSEKADPIYVSEPIASLTNIAVAKDGSFTFVTDNIVLPGKASPTGADIHIANFGLSGTIHEDGTFCGEVAGTVLEFLKDIKSSTFKAVPWGTQGSTPGSSCAAAAVKHYAGIATCPTLQSGVNTITSAERSRKFTVVLPADATAADMPIVFLFHGVQSDMGSVLGETHYADMQKQDNFVLVVPQSERDADGKAVSQTDWAYGLHAFDDDNQDLVFFDDMLKCVGQQYKTDPKRVYLTGMSGGGLMTVFTSFAREKVIAAAAPSSGGYLFKFPGTNNKFPELVTWGGSGDSAYGQNFDLFAQDLFTFLVKDGHYVVKCNHDTGHKWPSEMTAANWMFLSRFRLGEAPKPFDGDVLSAVFPKYCSVAK